MKPLAGNFKSVAVMAALIILAGLLFSGSAWAGYAAGRIRYMDGKVYLQKAQDSENAEVSINMPIEPGDRVWTAEDGKAEFQLPDSSVVRIYSDTKLDFLSIPEYNVDTAAAPILRLWSGSVYMETREDNSRDTLMQIDSPSCSMKILGKGLYRLDLDKDRNARVSVFDGVADVAGDSSSTIVNSGQRTYVYYGENPESPFSFNTAVMDDFGRWNDDQRSGYIVAGEHYELPNEPDYELPNQVQTYYPELSHNGSWVYLDDCGCEAWRPYVHVDWTPYSNGYWYNNSWGYTWVSSEPWGWAPYHWGRWNYSAGWGWSWIPGAQWAPAWVTWYVGPRYVGWSPIDYWGWPSSTTYVHDRIHPRHDGDEREHGDHRMDPKGWNMVLHEHFRDRNLRNALLPRDTVEAAEPGLYNPRIQPGNGEDPGREFKRIYKTGMAGHVALIGSTLNPAPQQPEGVDLAPVRPLPEELGKAEGLRDAFTHESPRGSRAGISIASPATGTIPSITPQAPGYRTPTTGSMSGAFKRGQSSSTIMERDHSFETGRSPSVSGRETATPVKPRSGVDSTFERSPRSSKWEQVPDKPRNDRKEVVIPADRETFRDRPAGAEPPRSFREVLRERETVRPNSPAPSSGWDRGNKGRETGFSRSKEQPERTTPTIPQPVPKNESSRGQDGFRSVMRDVFRNVPRSETSSSPRTESSSSQSISPAERGGHRSTSEIPRGSSAGSRSSAPPPTYNHPSSPPPTYNRQQSSPPPTYNRQQSSPPSHSTSTSSHSIHSTIRESGGKNRR